MTLQSSNTSITANTRVRWRFSGETTTHPVDNAALPAVTVNTPFTVEIKWANLCTYAGGSAACTTDITTAKTLSIGIDNNNDDTTLADKVDFNFVFRYLAAGTNNQLTATCSGTTAAGSTDQGICDYTVSRGDEKVYITDYAASSNDLIASLTNSAVKYNRLVLFYNEDASGADAIDGTTINNLSPSMTINLINNTPSEPSISDPRIRGLTNETFYCFALGNMDQTGIISYFPQTATLQDKTKVCAKPSQVVGLLDDKHCFIATATFGSSMAPEVQTFRQFRNEFLLTNRVGEQIVKFYYKVGPEGAEWISHSDSLRAMSVWALWPLLMFVKLSLWLGIVPATIVALLIAALIAFSVSRTLQYRRSLREAA